MLYYLGKGTEFKKEDCKEYKTIEGALKAAAKNEELVVRTDSRPPAMETMQQGRRHPETMQEKQRNRCPILTQSIRKRPQERSLIVMVL